MNDLETVSVVTSMISIYCGIFFIADKPLDWIKNNPNNANGAVYLSSDAKLGLFALILFSNLVFFVFWAFKMYKEIVLKFRKILPKVYTCLCLCGHIKKFEAVIKQDKLDEYNELLRDEYMECKLHKDNNKLCSYSIDKVPIHR